MEGLDLLLLTAGPTLQRFGRLLPRLGTFVKDADRAVFTYTIGHLERVDPKSQFAGQELEEPLVAQPNHPRRLDYQGVHLVVDPNAAVPGALGGRQGEPVVLVPLCGRNKEQRHRGPAPRHRAGAPRRRRPPAHRTAPPAGTLGSTAAAPRRYRRRPAGGG